MSGSCGESVEGKEKLGLSVENHGKGGGKSKGVRDVFNGDSACGTTFGGVDVGDYPPHGTRPGGVSTQGISKDH